MPTKDVTQSELNIGTLGHVDHGKTTLVQALTGVWASRHSEELKRGITIKLGYADAIFYKCDGCPPPSCYGIDPTCKRCGGKASPLRKVSFIDAPGHEILMTTMLSGAALMDAAIFVIGADETCPQPQTREHLLAARTMGIKNMIVVQNKIDIVSRERAIQSYEEIRNFLAETEYSRVPIIPISAQRKLNIDLLIEFIEKYFPTPKRDPSLDPLMLVIRTFDVNRPGTSVSDLKGGVLGGTLVQGELRVGDEIEIRPGARIRSGNTYETVPLRTTIVSLRIGDDFVEKVGCGGLVGVGTTLDPSLTKSDGLVGNLLARVGTLPPSTDKLTLKYTLFDEVVGMKETVAVEPLKIGEPLAINVGVAITSGKVSAISGDNVDIKLTRPVCVLTTQRVAISRNIMGRWRLIGYGVAS
ncbi:MAG: translation initiation factor IF-2 subunit gamma [Thermoproteota archaeon]